MKTILNVGVIMFASFIFSACGSSIENNSWSGEDYIAGVSFNYTLETKSDNTYKLYGNSAGIGINESGSYRKISDTEIVLSTGEFAGSKFIKDGSSLKWYMDNGDYFMTLD